MRLPYLFHEKKLLFCSYPTTKPKLVNTQNIINTNDDISQHHF